MHFKYFTIHWKIYWVGADDMKMSRDVHVSVFCVCVHVHIHVHEYNQ